MALQNQDMEYHFSSTAPSLTARDDESLMIKDIIVADIAVASERLLVYIDKALVGEFDVSSTVMGNHLKAPTALRKTLLAWLWDKGIFKGYPVSTGGKISLKSTTGQTVIGKVIYDQYDKGDITQEMENGPKSDTYMFINYGKTAAAVTTTTTTLLNTQINSTSFPAFPWGNDVPGNREIIVHGILASERSFGSATPGTNYMITNYLKLEDDRTTLFDEARDGIQLLAAVPGAEGFLAQTHIGDYGDYTNLWTRPPKLFAVPKVFKAGSELNVSWTTTVGGTSTISAEQLAIALIETVKVLKT